MKLTLKQWRALANMTQAGLAEASGVQRTKIAVFESLDKNELESLREALGLKKSDVIILP